MNNESKYICKLCNTSFANQGSYWVHVNRKKNACLSKERCLEIMSEIENKDNKIHSYEEQTKIQMDALAQKERENEETRKENEKLKEILTKLCNKDDILNKLEVQTGTALKLINKKLDDQKTELVIQNLTLNSNVNNNVNNNILLNNNNNKNIDNKMLFALNFTKKECEKVDHISDDMMMDILDHKEYNDTLKHVAKAVYFHPLAPQNFKWCVTDKNAHAGALEYNAESNTVVRKPASDVINTNMQNAMFQITDMLGALEKTNRPFNETQAKNCSKLFNSLGTDFTADQINNVKTVAYDGRNLVKALWESLFISLETTPITCKINF